MQAPSPSNYPSTQLERPSWQRFQCFLMSEAGQAENGEVSIDQSHTSPGTLPRARKIPDAQQPSMVAVLSLASGWLCIWLVNRTDFSPAPFRIRTFFVIFQLFHPNSLALQAQYLFTLHPTTPGSTVHALSHRAAQAKRPNYSSSRPPSRYHYPRSKMVQLTLLIMWKA
ncbi:hypothetical protein PQX77_017092 [Marasmius sp. AFHP31]|nr:hypothetical protein PQX77_017092 [Marasmius sp. AFHP31]